MKTGTSSMNGSVKHGALPEDSDALERRADASRARLFKLVDALDHKRHQFQKPFKFAAPVLVPLAAGAAIVGGVAAFAVMRRQHKPQPRSFLGLQRRQPPPSFWKQVGRQTGVGLLTFLLVEAGKHALVHFMKNADPKSKVGGDLR